MAPPSDLATVLQKLEELGKKMDHTNTKTEEMNRKIEEMQLTIKQNTEEQNSLITWKPGMEDKVTDLQNSVYDLKQKIDLFIHEIPKKKGVEEDPSSSRAPAPAHLGAAADAEALGPNGHREDKNHRSVGAGVVTTLVPAPVKGAIQSSFVSPVPFRGFDSGGISTFSQPSNFGHTLPQLEFPKFDGSNPKIWVKRCENYFDICDVPHEHWVKLATMYFSGSTAFWMQSIELDIRKLSWENLSKAVVDRFQRDQLNLVIRQFSM